MSAEKILQQLSESDKNDTRFQYDVIRNLAESVREQTRIMSDLQKDVHLISDRLTRIEANRLNEEVSALKIKVEALEAADHRREGAMSVGQWVFKGPLLGWIIAVVVIVAAFMARSVKL